MKLIYPWFESNYESEKDKALKELVLVKKRQEMEQKKIIKEISDMEFPKWRSKLTQEEIKEIVPNVAFQLGESTIDTVLRCHFEAEAGNLLAGDPGLLVKRLGELAQLGEARRDPLGGRDRHLALHDAAD